MMLFAARAALKLGWGRLQLPASGRPATVNRSSTPPLGALRSAPPKGAPPKGSLKFPLRWGSLVLLVPGLLKKNGNRTSRVGPLAVTKYGVVLPGATPL